MINYLETNDGIHAIAALSEPMSEFDNQYLTWKTPSKLHNHHISLMYVKFLLFSQQ